MSNLLINFLDLVVNFITLLVIVKVLLSYFMAPYHPVREALDRIVEPMLVPIRRFVRPVGMMDFSPIVLILLVYVIRAILESILRAIFVSIL